MPTLIRLSGPWGPMLALLGLLVLFTVVRATAELVREGAPSASRMQERQHAILFWGFTSAVFGFLGQCHATYLALRTILAAPEISMSVVADGFVISFLPALFGMGILTFALVCWGGLKLLSLGRNRPPGRAGALVLLLLLMSLATSCSTRGEEGNHTSAAGEDRVSAAQGTHSSGGGEDNTRVSPSGIGDGVWILDAGLDRFLWEFTRSDGALTCIVHDLREGMKLNETPCHEASLESGNVQVTMDTGVRLEGRVDLASQRIRGRLVYPGGTDQEVELPWAPQSDFPSLTPFPDGATTYVYRPPGSGEDGWAVADAADEGVDPAALEATVESVLKGEAGVLHSLLIARRGRLILEEYFHGYGPRDLHHLASSTKSVSSLLVGLAIQEGLIDGVETPVWTFFPYPEDSLGKGWTDLTLRHLLTMTMALDWSPDEVQNLHGTGPETFREILSREVVGTPGVDWEYASINVNLIAGILRDATGEQADVFARERLFGPLGIRAWDWEGMKTEGYPLMDGSLRLRPRDMARIGVMVAAGGAWQGAQIVDRDWVRASTARAIEAGSGPEGYGYLWWTLEIPVSGESGPGESRPAEEGLGEPRSGESGPTGQGLGESRPAEQGLGEPRSGESGPTGQGLGESRPAEQGLGEPGPQGRTLEAVFANGWGSQFIFVIPGLQLVVVTTGGNEFNGKHMAVAELLRRDLLPGVH